MKTQVKLALAFAAALIQGCGGQGDATSHTTAPSINLLAQVHAEPNSQMLGSKSIASKSLQQAFANINLDDIDKGTFCYAESTNRDADISDIKNSFNANNWLQTITSMYGRRWPSGQALAQAQANDQYFKQFVDTSSFNKLAESMMVAIHEETHMWDLAASRTEWNKYTSSWIDNTYQFIKFPLHDGFARKEILPLIKDDASSSTDGVYLKDAQQGEYHLQGVTAELNASLMGLPASYMVAEYIDGVGASNSRDLALTNTSYLQLYLRVAKQNYPAFYQKLKAEPQFRKYVLVQFLRMSYFVKLSERFANKLGSSNVPKLIARVYAPENLAILEDLSGYKFPTSLDDHCMGSNTPSAPVITNQPASQSVKVGQSVSFAVAASGSGNIRYQWRKNGTNIANASNANFSIAAATIADAGSYSVLVANDVGSVISKDAQLTVSINDTPSVPVITSQPQSLTVMSGQPASFAVVASGNNLRYQWRKNGANLLNANSAQFTLSAATTADSGSYSVLVSNDAGSVASSAALLSVNSPNASNVIINGGFENGSNPWLGTTTAVGDFSNYGYTAYQGKQMAWFGGYGVTTTENLYQQVTIPSGSNSAQLRFYLRVVSAEVGSTVRDKLAVQVLNSSGMLLTTAATYSNANAASGYKPYSLDLSAYKGKTVRVNFKMTENAQNPTSFFIDEVGLFVQ